MQQPQLAPYPISDFLQWHGMGQLELTPKFQRRGSVWPTKAKSYLIDTILRRMPIPPVFIRLRLDASNKRMIREVVDGQQRLRAVLEFVQGGFPVSAAHSDEFPNKHFGDLPEDVQQQVLSYKFDVSTFENVSDPDVLNVFARLNTYTVPLKGVELLNSTYFGAFKRVAISLALSHNAFWTKNKILSDQKIARMADVELVSELVISMIDGIRQTKVPDIEAYFKRYDDDFPEADAVTERFSAVIDVIGSACGNDLAKSPFRRVPLFYTLFLVVFDEMFGLPQSPVPARRRRRLVNEAQLRARLEQVSFDFNDGDPPDYAGQLKDLTAKATADAARRRQRHEILHQALFGQG